jgi:hypothetical protein
MSQVRGRPFGQGNKFGRGRPAGSRNKSTIALQDLLDNQGKAIIEKLVKLAGEGDKAALRLCVDRLVPPLRQRPVKFSLPAISTAADVDKALETVLNEVALGRITPAEGQAVTVVLEARRRGLETVQFDARLTAVEQQQKEETPQ